MSEIVHNFDFSDVRGFDIVSDSGVVKEINETNPNIYTLNFQVIFQLKEGYNVLEIPHISLRFVQNESTREIESDDSVNNDLYVCEWHSSNYLAESSNFESVVIGNASIFAPFQNDYPTVRVQRVSNSNINFIASNRFDVQLSDVDLATFIVSLLRYPFNVDVGDYADLILGNVVLSNTAPLVTEQYYNFNVFDDDIRGYYTDDRDFIKSEIFVDLPFYGVYQIDSKYINSHIKIVYKCDILANRASISILSNGVMIDFLECTLGYEIPYTFTTKTLYSEKVIADTLMNFEEPKLRINQKIASGNIFNINFIGSTSDFANGDFVSVDDFNEIKPTLNNQDFEGILNTLENGFII